MIFSFKSQQSVIVQILHQRGSKKQCIITKNQLTVCDIFLQITAVIVQILHLRGRKKQSVTTKTFRTVAYYQTRTTTTD